MMDEEQKRRLIVKADMAAAHTEREPRCCTKEAWEKRGIFTAKNVVALGAGLVISVITRIILSAAKKNDPRILGKSDGPLLNVTDIAGCMLTLVLCSTWVRPSPTYFSQIFSSPILLCRSVTRNGIPLFSALLTMFLVKWIDYKVHGPDHMIRDSNQNRIAEASDFVGGFLLLAAFHILDRILERCWPADIGEGRPLKKGRNAPNYGGTSVFQAKPSVNNGSSMACYLSTDLSDDGSSCGN